LAEIVNKCAICGSVLSMIDVTSICRQVCEENMNKDEIPDFYMLCRLCGKMGVDILQSMEV